MLPVYRIDIFTAHAYGETRLKIYVDGNSSLAASGSCHFFAMLRGLIYLQGAIALPPARARAEERGAPMVVRWDCTS